MAMGLKNWISCTVIVCLALISLEGCGKNTVSCHDISAKIAIRDFYRNGNLEIMLRNIRTITVNNDTGERICTGEAIAGDGSNGRERLVKRIKYTTKWNEDARVCDISIIYEGQ
jgi:hypothetical protein